ncbi:N,N-dimethylformamidase beta subunit family domain-containing protein [Plantactinospora sp. WMMC1484]|uniref:N,N-dimethylformamidase beta subunit family domain-containing protein n=1 Tax=Plantactinospora sp. WMMC1484 TaxID=3404122 RepID=UPI003BF5C67F
MSPLARRSALGMLAVGLPASVLALSACQGSRASKVAPPLVARGDAVRAENRLPGTRAWRSGSGGLGDADDGRSQIQGYASVTSAAAGEPIDFHVTVDTPQSITISIYRLGWYDGTGGRLVQTSEPLPGRVRPVPPADPLTGVIECHWPATWRVTVPADWMSGVYVAVFTGAGGRRSCTPFVVRDDRHIAELCVVLPFSTYQAYNQWPLDGRRGKSLYYGFPLPGGPISYADRAVRVSFDRPYSGGGWPKQFDRDHDFVQWVERRGYDVTYASTVDLHAGRIDPKRYHGLVFCGHDEYWSAQMRHRASEAVERGVSLAFLAANNLYWQIRLDPSSDGREHRTITCYKTTPDPLHGLGGRGATVRWRDIGGHHEHAEQGLLGVQYNGIVAATKPLVVSAADHWFWAGCNVTEGTELPRLVGGEADGYNPAMPAPAGVQGTILSASPYPLRNGTLREQNTHLYETPRGAVVFDAGTLHWTLGLNRQGYRDQKIQIATRNLLDRIVRRPPWT